MAVDYYCLAAAIVIETGVNDGIRFTDSFGTVDATLAAGTHFLYGGGTEANDFGKIVGDALTAASAGSGGDTLTCAYTGKVTAGGVTGAAVITSDDAFTILGTHANTTLDLGLLGLVDGADHVAGGGATVTSTLSPSRTWCSDQPPTLVDGDRVEAEVVQHVGPQGQRHTFAKSDPIEYRRLRFEYTHKDRVWEDDSSADLARTFHAWWKNARKGQPVRLYKENETSGDLGVMAAADLVGAGTYVLSEPLGAWKPQRDTAVPTWAWELELAEYFA